jgi:hypothetical protein
LLLRLLPPLLLYGAFALLIIKKSPWKLQRDNRWEISTTGIPVVTATPHIKFVFPSKVLGECHGQADRVRK